MNLIRCFIIVSVVTGWQPMAMGLDEDAAEALFKKSGCTKCHSISKRKDGPSMRDAAAKYRGRSDAEARLITHITTSPSVKLEGADEEHARIKTNDPAEIRNVVQWILSR
jgi:cytochrome c